MLGLFVDLRKKNLLFQNHQFFFHPSNSFSNVTIEYCYVLGNIEDPSKVLIRGMRNIGAIAGKILNTNNFDEILFFYKKDFAIYATLDILEYLEGH